MRNMSKSAASCRMQRIMGRSDIVGKTVSEALHVCINSNRNSSPRQDFWRGEMAGGPK